MKVLGINKMQFKTRYNSMALKVCMIDLADSCFKGIKARDMDKQEGACDM